MASEGDPLHFSTLYDRERLQAQIDGSRKPHPDRPDPIVKNLHRRTRWERKQVLEGSASCLGANLLPSLRDELETLRMEFGYPLRMRPGMIVDAMKPVLSSIHNLIAAITWHLPS